MNEILQKVKGVSGTQSAMGQMEDGDSSLLVTSADEAQENNNGFDSSGAVKVSSESTIFSSIDTSNNPLGESTFHPVHVNGVHSSTSPAFHSESTNSSDEVDVSSSHLITVEQESTYTLTSNRSNNEHEKETVSFQYSEESSTRDDFDVNGTNQVSETDQLPDTEATMVSTIHAV